MNVDTIWFIADILQTAAIFYLIFLVGRVNRRWKM